MQQMNVMEAKTWRHDAARIVEELFRSTSPDCWDLLIDLRRNLLTGQDWNHTLDVFLACRERMELSHYLPFYRLRNLLAGSLKLEAGQYDPLHVGSLGQILRRKHRSLAEIRRHVVRELFEHDVVAAMDCPIELVVVER